ncbi:MAG: ADOP family duplicated permease, partial [Gemmatimonadota bacterium]
MITDLKYALRHLAARPLFALVAVLSLGIGIGATTAAFSVANRLLLRAPAGIGEPERVVEIGRTTDGDGFDSFGYPDLQAMREQADPLEQVAGWRTSEMSVALGGGGERVMGMNVSWNYFAALGLRPALGRWFLPEEDAAPGERAVAVVSHRFWRERLGGTDDVIGRELMVNRHPFTIVGVTPPDFRSHMLGLRPDVFVPMMMATVTMPGFDLRSALESRRTVWFTVLGRLRPGATVAQADGAVEAVFARLRAEHPEVYERRGAAVMELGPVPGAGRGPATLFMAMLLGLVGLILLVTCANIAGMLLVRAADREKEIAVRLALGAGRWRLVRKLLTEALVLFVVGGGMGVLVAFGATRALAAVELPAQVPIRLDFSPDLRVLGFALLVSLGTGIVFGLLPALQASRLAPASSLKADAGVGLEVGRGRLRRVFVAAQVGLSLILLVAAGLFLRSLQRAGDVPTGFDAPHAVVMPLDLSLDAYSGEEGLRFFDRLLERTRALPGVDGAAVARDLPLDLSENAPPIRPEGWTDPADGGERWPLGADYNIVTPGYFAALGIRMFAGRDFTPADDAGAERVAVISRTIARRAWPDGEAIGRTLIWGGGGGESTPRTVVGVVDDVKNQTLTEEQDGMVYVPYAQAQGLSGYLVVRAAAPNAALGAA